MAQAAEFGTPVNIMAGGTQEDRGERAKLSNIVGATAIADLVKTTLGPKGMDKIIQKRSGSVTVTNDGATILRSIPIDNPAAKILINISKTQDDEVGDGTTSVCVLAGELLREAEHLLDQKIHPQTIVDGYRVALDAALGALESSAIDHQGDDAAVREDLLSIARTTLSSKVLTNEREHFSRIAVDAVLRLKGSTNLDSIFILKKAGGNLRDSFLEEGFILDKKFGVGQSKKIQNARIMVANTSMDTDKIKIYGARVKTSSYQTLADIEKAEKDRMKDKVESILSHDINLFINRQLIYNYPEQIFTEAGVNSIEHADFEGIERLALALGAEVVSNFKPSERDSSSAAESSSPSKAVRSTGGIQLGYADVVEEIMIGEDNVIRFSGVASGSACTIVLRGANNQVLDEAERSLHDALCVVSQAAGTDTRIVYGGGCSECLMARVVEEEAKRTPGKKQLAMMAFARALRTIPTIIADNAGYDSAELVSNLVAEHNQGSFRAGLDMKKGCIGDMSDIGVVESYKVKRHVVTSAEEAAEMILRVDDIVQAAPRPRDRD